MRGRNAAALASAMVTWLAAAGVAAQEPVADFYHNRVVQMLVGYGTGSGYDVYARVLSLHLGNHVAGHPTVVVDNMPGAGGLTMMNNLMNSAPRDGSVIAMGAKAVLFEPLYANKLARYDPLKISWIGGMTREVPLCFTRHSEGPTSFADAEKQEILVGATGKASDSYFYPHVLDAALGTKFKVVLGYPDSGAVGLAMERGEIQGMCGLTYGTVKSAHPEWLSKRKIDILAQLTFERAPELPDVPSLADLVKDDSTRKMLEVAFGTADMARPVIGAPDLPSDRLAALRQAFLETMDDPEFIGDASRTGLDTAPIAAATLADELAKIYQAPKAIVQKIIAIRDGR